MAIGTIHGCFYRAATNFVDNITQNPSTSQLESPVPNNIPRMVFGTRVLKQKVLVPSGRSLKEGLLAPFRWFGS